VHASHHLSGFFWLALVLLCLIALCACSSHPVSKVPANPALERVLAGQALLATEELHWTLPDDRVMALNDDMHRFLAAYVPGGSDKQKLSDLLYAIMHQGLLGLTYNPHTTYTAADTFLHQQGNCLSFTTMFIALAREVGLKAYFNEVDVPPVWDLQSESTYVVFKHINAVVNVGRERKVVDLNLENYDVDYQQRKLPDRQAEAQYYNNRSMEHLYARNSREAFRYLRKAIELAPELDYLWSNLGTIYRREGLLAEAEIAFHQALRLNPRSRLAASNLGRLYKQLGNDRRAAEYEQLVERFRLKNPYYRYHLAQTAVAEKDYRTALKHIRAAINAEDRDHRFHFLAANIYYALDLPEQGRASLQRAAKVTQNSETQGRYRRKLNKLLALH